jgi:dTMP kinase
LIVIEGIDASGKATQSKLLAQRLAAERFSFPNYKTPLGKAILRHLKRETHVAETIETLDITRSAPEDALVFQAMCLANKCEMLPEMINAHLSHDIVCDRWWPSAVAYGQADGLDRKWLESLHVCLRDEMRPRASAREVYFFLDVSEQEALRRRPEARDRYEQNREKQQQVRENYLALWKGRPSWYVIDGVGTVEDVQERIMKCLEKETDL